MIEDSQAKGIDHPDFRVKNQIASGGMGAVLEVEEATTLRPVALKVMHPAAMESAGARQRFLQEARILGRLEHPNIVPIHVLKRDADGKPFYTMKKVQGRDLQQILSAIRKGDRDTAKQFPLARLLQVLQRVCEAVGYAHSKGVVHRDLKPANIMVGEFGEVLVMDWGLAKIIDEEEAAGTPSGRSEGSALQDGSQSASLTMEGLTVGTPQFMAPEQADGRLNDINERTDTWALGGILYAILTLHPPFTGANAEELLTRVRAGEFASATLFQSARTIPDTIKTRRGFKLIHCPGHRIPPAIAAIVKKALTVDANERYASAHTFQQDIEAWQNGFATSAEKAGFAKQLGLLIWRHKLVTLGLLVTLLLGIGFGVRVHESAQRREIALSELRSSIPLLAADVDELLSAGDYEAAQERLDQCVRLLPDNASFHLQKGLLYQSARDFSQAIDAFQRAINLDPDSSKAVNELDFTTRLRDSTKNDDELFEELSNHLVVGKRFAELSALSLVREKKKQAQKGQLEKWKKQMTAQGGSSQLAASLEWDEHRDLRLEISDPKLTSIEFLKGIPLNSLEIEAEKLLSLDPLAGMPLTSIHLTTPAAIDLTPLKDMKLRTVTIRRCRARDFDVFAGMPIESIELEAYNLRHVKFLSDSVVTQAIFKRCRLLTDLKSLAGKPIRKLNLSGTAVMDLSFAEGMPLRELDLTDTDVADLAPLKGIKLEELSIRESKVSDLSPLEGAPLRDLTIAATKVSDLSPIADAELRRLEMWGTRVTDLGPLNGQPLRSLTASGTRIRDLRPLSGGPIRTLMIQGCNELKNLNGLETCMELEFIAVPSQKLILDPIRNLPKLKKLSFGAPPDYDWGRVIPIEQYWPVYDKWRRAQRFR